MLSLHPKKIHTWVQVLPPMPNSWGPEYILVWPCLPEHSYKNMSHYTPTLLKICAACLFASVFCLCLSPNLYVKFVPSYLCANLCMCLCLALHLCFYVSKIHACASIGLRIYISIFQHVYMRICLCLSVCVCASIGIYVSLWLLLDVLQFILCPISLYPMRALICVYAPAWISEIQCVGLHKVFGYQSSSYLYVPICLSSFVYISLFRGLHRRIHACVFLCYWYLCISASMPLWPDVPKSMFLWI